MLCLSKKIANNNTAQYTKEARARCEIQNWKRYYVVLCMQKVLFKKKIIFRQECKKQTRLARLVLFQTTTRTTISVKDDNRITDKKQATTINPNIRLHILLNDDSDSTHRWTFEILNINDVCDIIIRYRRKSKKKKYIETYWFD